MARRRRRAGPSISLFPFLSVLACVIGTLVLLITASATRQVAAGGLDLERYERLEQEVARSRTRLDALSRVDAELPGLEADVEAARARERTLAAEREAEERARIGNAPLRDALAAAEERVAALEGELAPLARSADAKQQEIEQRRRVLSRAPIRIRPSGSGYGLDPHFVECRPEGIVYYEGLERRPVPVATHRIAGDAGYRRFLRAAVYRSNTSVVFLIRRGGVDACEWARAAVRQQRLRHGEIPLASDGPLDFSAVGGA